MHLYKSLGSPQRLFDAPSSTWFFDCHHDAANESTFEGCGPWPDARAPVTTQICAPLFAAPLRPTLLRPCGCPATQHTQCSGCPARADTCYRSVGESHPRGQGTTTRRPPRPNSRRSKPRAGVASASGRPQGCEPNAMDSFCSRDRAGLRFPETLNRQIFIPAPFGSVLLL